MRRIRQGLRLLPLIALALLIWTPVWMLLTGAFTSAPLLTARLSGVLGAQGSAAYWTILPPRATLQHFIALLLDTPAFYRVFLNSVLQVFPAVLLQVLIAAPAAWALARYRFPGRKLLRRLYIALMILPFQATMASNYLVLNRLGLIDTPFSIILPAAFSAFPVFILTRFFAEIPTAMLEAACIDGAGEARVFRLIGLPLGFPGVLSAALLGFIEGWNAVEQPITFLKTASLYPLSIYLPKTTVENAGLSFVSALIALIPALLLFLCGQRYLEQGIVASGIKE